MVDTFTFYTDILLSAYYMHFSSYSKLIQFYYPFSWSKQIHHITLIVDIHLDKL